MPSRRRFKERILAEARSGLASSGTLLSQILALTSGGTTTADSVLPMVDPTAPSASRTTASDLRRYILGITGGVVNIPEAALLASTLGVTGLTTLTGGLTIPTTVTATLPDTTNVGQTSTPIFSISGFNAAQFRMLASNVTASRRNWGLHLDGAGLKLRSFSDALSQTNDTLFLTRTAWDGIHTATFGGTSGWRIAIQLPGGAVTPSTPPLNIGQSTNNPTTLVDGDMWITSTSFRVYYGGASRLVNTNNADVVGPASATDNAVVRFDGTTGKLVQNSAVTIEDTGTMAIAAGGLSFTATNQSISMGGTSVIVQEANYHRLIRRDGGTGIFLGGSGDQANYYDNGIHYFRNSASAILATITGSGTRSFMLDTGGGVLNIKGDTGGWATQHGFTGSSNTNRGGFGALGSADSLSYYYVGPAYDSTAAVLVYPSGTVAMQGATGGTNAQFNLGNTGATMNFYSSLGAANAKNLRFRNDSGLFHIEAINDAYSTAYQMLGFDLALQQAYIPTTKYLAFDQTYPVHGRIRYDSALTASERAFVLDAYYGFSFMTRTLTPRMTIRGDTGAVSIGNIAARNSAMLDVEGGKIRAGTQSPTGGSVILEDGYTDGSISSWGTNYSSGGPMMMYGVIPSVTVTNEFRSSTGINANRGAFTIDGGVFRWFSATASTVAIGSPVALSQRMTLDASGQLGIGTSSPNAKLDVRGNVYVGAGQYAASVVDGMFISNTVHANARGVEFFASTTENPRAWIAHTSTTTSQKLTFDSTYGSGTGYATFEFLNGAVTIGNLAGVGTRLVGANASGQLVITTGGSGDVVGPASATDNALVRFDATTGKLVQNSNATLSDAGNLTLAASSLMKAGNFVTYAQNGAYISMKNTADRYTLYMTDALSFEGAGSADNAALTAYGTLRFYPDNNAGTIVCRAEIDNTATAGNTALRVYDVDNAALERVTVGAADSGGTGFKVLRIPN